MDLQDWIASLRAHVEQDEAEVADLARALKGREDRLKRARRALRELEGPQAAPSKPAKPSSKRGRQYKPSDDALARVMEALRGGAETQTEIARASNLSGTAVKVCLDVLREAERVRLAGRRDTGTARIGPALYALMPGALVHA